jgi:L-ascorbate metabolism protein UlaG (beta-lactamase superfamily)
MKLKWLGHASFLLATRGKKIYIDPYVGDYTEKADVVLISHGHGDHCDLEKLSMVRTPKTVIYTSEACAEGIPPGNVVTMSPGESKDLNGVTVHAVEAYNYKRFRSPGVPFHPEGTQIGFIVESEGKRIYHAGDSDYLPSMNDLEDVTLALLPIMGRAVMDVDEAVEAAIGIAPEMVMPMHWRSSDPEEFKRKVEARSELKVVLMEEGEEITL